MIITNLGILCILKYAKYCMVFFTKYLFGFTHAISDGIIFFLIIPNCDILDYVIP